MGANMMKTANSWPPNNITYQSYYLKKGPTGSVKSLNDGALDTTPPAADGGETEFNYPDPGWRAGVVTFGPQGPDPVARILTFTSSPLEADLEVVGPIKLVLYAASSNTDTDFIVKLSEQFPPAAAEQAERAAALPRGQQGLDEGVAPRAQHAAVDANLHPGTRTRGSSRSSRASPTRSKCR